MNDNEQGMISKNNSPYSASITGCAFLYNEFMRVLPLLMDENADSLLKEEVLDNRILQVNSQKARERFIAEFKRRYRAVPVTFWKDFVNMGEAARRAGLLYAILKAYKLVFDFHFNVTVRHWNSVNQTLYKRDIMMELSELSSRDAFVDSWTEMTKDKCASQYLTILRQAGMLQEKTNELRSLHLEAPDFEYYVRRGEEWFLEACLLYPYEINNIKKQLS